MIVIKDKSRCSGCWACANICPKQCIEMQKDNEGFHYPVANRDACTDCGLCENVCPILKPEMSDALPQSYVVQNKDKQVLRDSTSGGFFTEIARYAIAKGGVVFGAAFDDQMVLRHAYGETMDECAKFRGSKYVQSLVGDAYSQVKKFLEQGRMVIFSGTPCQISGLYGYLMGRKYEGLVTVDLVCRGTPSPLLLEKYLKKIGSAYSAEVVDYRSRDKHYGYDYSTSTVYFADKSKAYHKGKDSDALLGLYFNDICSRPSCYACHFKTISRVSDITIFDCWDAPSVSDKFTRDGATNVFVHTERGHQVFEQLKDGFVWSKADIEPIIARDGVMIKHIVKENPRRSDFFRDLNALPFDQVEVKYNHRSLLKRVLSVVKPLAYKFGVFQMYMRVKGILV